MSPMSQIHNSNLLVSSALATLYSQPPTTPRSDGLDVEIYVQPEEAAFSALDEGITRCCSQGWTSRLCRHVHQAAGGDMGVPCVPKR